jgi:hypothetical protein
MYCYNFKWEISSSGMPDAGGNINDSATSFRELFTRTFHELDMKLPDLGLGYYTYMFEMMSPFNRVVVQQPKADIVFLGARNNITGQEISPDECGCSERNWKPVRQFDLKTEADVIATLEPMKGLDQEGYVVVDANFNRIKVKCPDYRRLHRLRGNGNLSPKGILDLVRLGNTDEILASFPEFSKPFERVQSRYDALVDELNAVYAGIRDLKIQKDFALEAVKHRCSGALFQLRAGRVTNVKQFLSTMVLDNLADTLELKSLEF